MFGILFSHDSLFSVFVFVNSEQEKKGILIVLNAAAAAVTEAEVALVATW